MSTKASNESTPPPFSNSVFARSLYTSRTSFSGGGSPRTPGSSDNKRDLDVRPQQQAYSPYSSTRNGLLVTPPNAALSCTSSPSSSSSTNARGNANSHKSTTPQQQQLPTGSWSHPALQGLQKARQRRGSPQYALWRVFMNGLAYSVYVWLSQISLVSDALRELVSAIFGPPSTGSEWKAINYVNKGFQWVLLINICDALIRLLWAVQSTLQDGDDEMLVKETEIRESLTPTQRRLLGLRLDPSPKSAERNAPQVGGGKHPTAITPPRYAKTSPQTRPRPRVSPMVKGVPSPTNVTETGYDTTLALISSPTPSSFQQQRAIAAATPDGDKSLMLKGNIETGNTRSPSSSTTLSSNSPLSSFTTSNRYRYMASNRRAANYI